MKILVISHSLIQSGPQARWRRMAATYPDLSIRLLIPERWITDAFDNEIVFEGVAEKAGNFEVRPVRLTNERDPSTYLVHGLSRELQDFKPEIIFPVHENYQLLQTIIWRQLFAPAALLPFFTMNTFPRTARFEFTVHPKQLLINLEHWLSWWLVRHGTDAAMCHFPGIEQQIRQDGYRRPVIIQTQIGVDENLFYPDVIAGSALRDHLGLDGFVVGFAGRVMEDKGILDLAEAMNSLPREVRLLVVGDGPDRGRLEEMAAKAGWHDRLHLVGYIPFDEVANYMRAMDCLVAGSRTTTSWVDTFPLVVAQAMATGLPVVGSDSGAIPFQLGGEGLVFAEGDVDAIAGHLKRLRDDPTLRERMGRALLERARREFCIEGINPKLYAFFETLWKNAPEPSLLRRLARLNVEKVRRHVRWAWQDLRCRLERLLGRGYPPAIDQIATNLTACEKQTLFRIAQGLPSRSIVAEIGSFHGASSCCLAAGVRRRGGKVFCVDTWMNDATSYERADVFDIWRRHTAPFSDSVSPVHGYSHQVVNQLPDNLDLIFIDGDHSYEGVKRDLQLYLPKLRANGVLLMHDWSHDSVRQAICDFVQPHETERMVEMPNLYACRIAYRHN